MVPETGRLLGLVGMGLSALILTNGMMLREARAVEGLPTDLRPEIGVLTHDYFDGRFSSRRQCTATLVTPDFVLTAAHCVDYSPDNSAEYAFFIYPPKGPRTLGVDVFKYKLAEIFTFGETRHWGNHIPSDDELMAVRRYPTPTGRGNDDVALLHLAASVPADVATPSGVATWYPDVGETVTLFGYGGR